MNVLISLIGEQPAPNVLPVAYYNPDQVVLVCTDRTKNLATRIANVLEYPVFKPFCHTTPYRVDVIHSQLEKYVAQHFGKEDNLIFNLTGGTKTMEFAALEVARNWRAKAFYYQTEANQSLIHPYHFKSGNMVCESVVPVETTLTINQYLRLYISKYKQGEFKNDFERNVFKALQTLSPSYEVYSNLILTGVGPNVEVDWVLRFRNTFAVGEVKLKAKKTDGIDQLNGITDQRTLGTYTRKFLITADEPHPNDLDLAQAYRINIVVLPSGRGESLSKNDIQHLLKTIKRTMEPR